MNNEYIMRFKVHYRVMKERKLKERKKKTRSLKSLEKRNGITQTVGSDKNMLTL